MQQICTRILALALLLECNASLTNAQVVSSRLKEVFKKTDLKSNLLDPWEITYAPDGFLWITEAKGYKVIRMNPANGDTTVVLDLQYNTTNTPALSGLSATEFSNFKRTFTGSETDFKWPQGGMMGMAFHPEFNTDASKRFVYLAYVRSWGGRNTTTTINTTYPDGQGIYFSTFLTRWTYDPTLKKLISPEKIMDSIPGSSDHNSGRMIIAPEGNTFYLYYAVGDMGAGQFENNARVIKAQDPASIQGKILRFNLQSPWIPSSNPSATSPIFSRGIRNNQGFAYAKFGTTDRLFGSSHGPFSDDEINLIENGKNYGHPLVIGYSSDGNYNNTKAGATGGSLPFIAASNGEQNNAASIGTSYKDPIYSFYDATQTTVRTIYLNNGENRLWPSEAPSGIDIYTGSAVPGWKNSMIMASLKWGRILRLKLNSTGTGIIPIDEVQDTATYLESTNRYRDVAINPDNKTFYTIMDLGGASSGPSEPSPIVPACGGCVQAFTFLGYNDISGASTIPTSIPIAPGTPDNCEILDPIVINSDNTNLWVPITDANSNVVAEIKANGNAIGTVSAKLYKNDGSVRIVGGQPYLDRNVAISVSGGAGPFVTNGGVDVRIYLTAAEYDALELADAGITDISNLGLYKTSSFACQPEINAAAVPVSGTTASAFGSNGYVLKSKVTSFSTFFIAESGMTLLPVVIKEMNVNWLGNQASVSWSTVTETNTASFDIERSTDGRKFTIVGNVRTKGNSNVLNSYRFNDASVATLSSPIFYYRINVKDLDGKSAYSNTVSLSRGGNSFFVKAYPNPVKSTAMLNIFSDKNEKITWQLTDVSGRTIRNNVNQINKGQNNIIIDMNSIPAGIYQLLIKGQQFSQTLKLQKQ